MKKLISVLLSTLFLLPLNFFQIEGAKAADTTISKTITVKTSDGNYYQGAKIVIHYASKLLGVSGETSDVFTDAAGRATVQYPSSASYAIASIVPPADETKWAIGVIEDLVSLSENNLNFTLKAGDLKFQVKNPDGTDGGTGTNLYLGNKYIILNRTGPFLMNSDEIASKYGTSGIDLFMNNSFADTGKVNTNFYFSSTDTPTGWKFKFANDYELTSEIVPINDTIFLTYGKANIEIQLQSAEGTNLTQILSRTVSVNMYKINDELLNISTTSNDNSWAEVGTIGKAYLSITSPGRYQILLTSNQNPSIPNFTESNIWVNSKGEMSTTSADTGFIENSGVIKLGIRIPAKFARFHVNYEDGVTSQNACLNFLKKIGANYEFREGFPNAACAIGSDASIALPLGDYRLDLIDNSRSRPIRNFYLTVTESDYVLKDDNNEPLDQSNGIFNLKFITPNFKVKVTNGSKVLPNVNVTYKYNDNLYSVTTNENGEAQLRTSEGVQDIEFRPSTNDSLSAGASVYEVTTSSNMITKVINKVSGIQITANSANVYELILPSPNFIVSTILNESNLPASSRIFQLFKFSSNKYWEPMKFHYSNSQGQFGTNLETGKYRFVLFSNDQGVGDSLSLNSCDVIANQKNACTLRFPVSQLKLNGINSKNEIIQGNYSYNIYSNLSEKKSIVLNGKPNVNSNLTTFGLEDGSYSLTIRIPSENSSQGADNTYLFNVVSGSITELIESGTDQKLLPIDGIFSIKTKAINFEGKITYNDLNVSGSYVTVRTQKDSAEIQNGYTNSEGTFGFSLLDGDYDLEVQPNSDLNGIAPTTRFKLTVQNKVVSSLKNSSGAEVTIQNGLYPIKFDTPNITGTVKWGTESLTGTLITRILDSSGSWYAWDNYRSVLSSESKYVMKLKPGQYVFNLYGNEISGSNQVNSLSDVCTVPESGEVNCDIKLPSSNFKFNIINSTGQGMSSGYYLSTTRKYSNGAVADICCTFPKSETKMMALLDGAYTVYLSPDGSLPLEYQPNIYDLVITSGVITSIKETRSGVVPELLNEVYQLKFASPGVQGIVLGIDGVSPYPNGQVIMQSQRIGFGTQSNSAGRFAFQIVDDGIYDIVAIGDGSDISIYPSEPQKITVTGGKAGAEISLKLRAPNITVTVRGPDGSPSANNWINLRKLDSYGLYQYVPNNFGRSTNSLGQFSYYLTPGSYVFEAQADSNSGGVRTLSAPCVITEVIPNCDFNLLSSNFKIKVKDSTGTFLSNSVGNGWLISSSNTSLKNYDYFYSNTSGFAESNLTDGTWTIRIDPPYGNNSSSTAFFEATISGGVVTSLKDSSGNSVSATDGIFELVLPSANLIGTIKFGGNKVNYWNNVTLLKVDGPSVYQIDGRGTNNGVFGFKVEPGTYRIQAQPYAGSNSKLSTTRSALCEVAKTGVTTCDVNLQNGNLQGQIRASDNSLFRDFYANIFTTSDAGENWYQPVNLYDGNFVAFLEDGTYRLNVAPYWEMRALYSDRNYEIKVAGGVITSILDKNSNTSPTKIGDYYQFVLSAPSIKGSVYQLSGSSVKVPSIQIAVFKDSGEELWQYSTQTDLNGDFGLALPPGTYDLVARVWSKTATQGSSAKTRIVVDANGVVADPIRLDLRTPTIYGVVVKPGTTEPLSGVGVNIYMNGEWSYTWTEADGKFGAVFENAIPNPCDSCWISLNPWGNSDYTSKNYSFAAAGNLNNLEVGGVTAKVTVTYPSGSNSVASKWSYVAVEEFNGGNYQWQPGSYSNELGIAGLALVAGKKYRLTAYPDWQKSGEFSPKSIILDTFTLPANAAISIQFDTPNSSFALKNAAGVINSWGRYEIYTVSGETKTYFRDGYLNAEGRGSQTLADGTYDLKFFPGKAAGSPLTIQVTVASGVATYGLSATTALNMNLTLPNGNFSGYVKNGTTPVEKATVVAVSGEIKASAVTDATGKFEMTLDATLTWKITAVDPISGAKNADGYTYSPDGTPAPDATIAVPDIGIS